jgi:hypothetical protein
MNNEHENLIRHLKGIRKVVINNCHGGFGLSPEAVLKYCEKSGIQVWLEYDEQFKSLDIAHYFIVPPEQRIEASPVNWHDMTLAERQAHNAAYSKTVINDREIARDDPYLVQVVEEMGADASGKFAELKVVEIPADVDWTIDEYDGAEWVAEKHRVWR